MKTIMCTLMLVGSLLGGNPVALAKGDVDIAFHGTLLEPPPCVINDGSQIDVNFGERVGINKVDGENYRQALNYQIVCENADSGNWALTLSLNGAASAFDKEALLTSEANLGIRVYQNDRLFTPGSAVNIELANPPRLEAVPVKRAGIELTEGTFEAWATLRADYQ